MMPPRGTSTRVAPPAPTRRRAYAESEKANQRTPDGENAVEELPRLLPPFRSPGPEAPPFPLLRARGTRGGQRCDDVVDAVRSRPAARGRVARERRLHAVSARTLVATALVHAPRRRIKRRVSPTAKTSSSARATARGQSERASCGFRNQATVDPLEAHIPVHATHEAVVIRAAHSRLLMRWLPPAIAFVQPGRENANGAPRPARSNGCPNHRCAFRV